MAHSLRCRLKELWRKGMLKDGDLERIVIIPKDATNGDVIKAMYPNIESRLDEKTGIMLIKWADGTMKTFKTIWWDAPYRGDE